MITGSQSRLRILVEDLGWCWWTQPRATRIGDRLFLGGIASDGEVFAAAYSLRTGDVARAALARLEPDDHNNPALVATPGKRLLAFYSRHDADDLLRYRLSSRAEDVSEWGDERCLPFGAVTTYAQVHTRGDEVHVFTRVGDTAWGYARSDDWGETWHEPLLFVALETDQETYMPTALLPDGSSLRIAIAGHPKRYRKAPWHEIRVCNVNLETGDVTRPSDRRVLANLRDGGGLPVAGRALELVCEAAPGRTINLFDVADGDGFEVGYASKVADDGSTIDATYHVAHLREGRWQVEDVVAAGTTFGYIDAGFYVGGIAFPHETSGGRAFITREENGVWRLERWDRAADGRWSVGAELDGSTRRIVRPWPVRRPTPGLEVVALALERYEDEYMHTLSHLVGGAFGEAGATL